MEDVIAIITLIYFATEEGNEYESVDRLVKWFEGVLCQWTFM